MNSEGTRNEPPSITQEVPATSVLPRGDFSDKSSPGSDTCRDTDLTTVETRHMQRLAEPQPRSRTCEPKQLGDICLLLRQQCESGGASASPGELLCNISQESSRAETCHKSSPKRRGWRKHLGEVRAGAEEGRGVSVPAPDWEQWEGTSQEPGVTPAQAGSSPAR